MGGTLQTRRRAALLVFLGVASACAWFLWGLGPGGPQETIASTAEAPAGKNAAIEPELALLPDAPPEAAREWIELDEAVAGDVGRNDEEAADEEVPDRVLKGSVFDTSGSPVKGASVAFAGVQGNTPKNSSSSPRVRTNALGEFALPVPEWVYKRKMLVVARKRGWRPYSAMELVDDGYLLEEQALTLGAGFAIDGRVVRDGQPVAGASISFDVAKGKPGVHVAGAECWWENGRLEEKRGSTETAEDGSFLLLGLSPREHRLDISEVVAPENRIAGRIFQVAAPSSETYDLSSAMLRITLQSQSGYLPGIPMTVRGEHGRVKIKSADDPVEVEVPPQEVIRIRASLPDGQRVEESVTSPLAGQIINVALVGQSVERPSLTATLPGATAAGIDRLSLCFFEKNKPSPKTLTAEPTDQPGTFRIDSVPLDSGVYRVILNPKDGGGKAKFLVPEQKKLELPATGAAHIDFSLEVGGRCKVSLSSDMQEGWSATYRLRDAQGKTRMKRTVWRESFEDDGGVGFSTMETSERVFSTDVTPSASDWAKTRGVLAPGTYTLEVTSSEHAKWTETVIVTAGETTKVKVQLQLN